MSKPKKKAVAPKNLGDHGDPDTDPNYRMGKRTGYSEVDGYLALAPCYSDSFNRLINLMEGERIATREALEVIHRQSREREGEFRDACRKWWQNVSEDLGIDLKLGWEYLPGVGAIRIRECGPVTVKSDDSTGEEPQK